jgi:hypothetical protein
MDNSRKAEVIHHAHLRVRVHVMRQKLRRVPEYVRRALERLPQLRHADTAPDPWRNGNHLQGLGFLQERQQEIRFRDGQELIVVIFRRFRTGRGSLQFLPGGACLRFPEEGIGLSHRFPRRTPHAAFSVASRSLLLRRT